MDASKIKQEEKFISVYHTYVDEVYRFILLRIGMDQTIAEDITQEIFIEIYRSLSGFKGLSSERTWIFRITKNKLNDYYRKQYRSLFEYISLDETLNEQLWDDEQDVQEIQIKAFEQDKVWTCLRTLQAPYRIVLILKFMDEKSVKEIALLTGKTPKAIESLLQRAKNAFIKKYAQADKEGLNG